MLEIRRRLQAEGPDSTDGAVRDFGPVYSLHYGDPDGVHLEVDLSKESWGSPSHPVLPRAEWTVIDLDGERSGAPVSG
jgi:hypothetical protein